MKLLKIGLALSVLGLTGCATVMSESRYPVDIQSTPTGAKFTIKDRDGKVITQGKTPQKVTLAAGAGYFKKATYEITFEGKEFGKITKTLEPQIDGWYWANFAIGGPVGLLIVDPLTGAMYKLPEIFSADLNTKGNNASLTIISVEHLDDKQKSQLIKLN